MDKLIIEFNKKFDKQKQELIDGFKALGEEKRLPKALATIEGEQPTYKDYFKAGWQSKHTEVENLQEEYAETELYLRGQLTDRGSKIANLKYLVEQDKSHIQTLNKKLEEKDKRIESALSELESLHNKKWAEWKEQADMHSQGEANAYEHAMQILEKTLRGEHANS